jgi:rod shape-determining protein MreD
MTIDLLKRAGWFVVFVLVQAIVLGRIHLFHCATPLFYVYFVTQFPRNYPKWGILLWAFAMGLTTDMFANTPGVSSASLTLIGALQPYLLMLFLPREPEEHHPSSAAGLGWAKFVLLVLIITLLYCLVFFTLEAFSFFNWQHWIESVGGSTVLTTILKVVIWSAAFSGFA